MNHVLLDEMTAVLRGLVIDAVSTSGRGHMGMPLGFAEVGVLLYGKYLRHNPTNPSWFDRDRLILSAGHGCLLQYSLLILSGYSLKIDDLKNYRKLGSLTPSHPELGKTPGVESSTGVDGQGIAHGVGQAFALKIANERLKKGDSNIIQSKVYVIAGDGCLMEGISSEACSFAGHHCLNNLIIFYDCNKTSLDGWVSESFSEDVPSRFKSYGWDVVFLEGNNVKEIIEVLDKTRQIQEKPLLIITNTLIGRGLLSREGDPSAHGGTISLEEVRLAKQNLGLPSSINFYLSESVQEFQALCIQRGNELEKEWNNKFNNLAPEEKNFLEGIDKELSCLKENNPLNTSINIPQNSTGRTASHIVLQEIGKKVSSILVGSADLARSDMTYLREENVILPPTYKGRNIKFGVREFGMGGISIGIAQTKLFIPIIGTFLAFSDYMANAIRMASLMKLKIIYHFSHDSIFIGGDGATHQPIEHLAWLRAIPNLQVIRPGDRNEIISAWNLALDYDGPTALILSRNTLEDVPGTSKEETYRGAYVIKQGNGREKVTIFATGTELSLAFKVSQILEEYEVESKIISVPCWEIFFQQSEKYKRQLLSSSSSLHVSIEAASSLGWAKFTGTQGINFGINSFGESGSEEELREHFGFSPSKIALCILEHLDVNQQKAV